MLGEVAYAAGHLDVTIEAWERAHTASMQAGDQVAAAAAAVRVAMHLLFDTALMAPVRGWLARAERLLEAQGETPAHAWFAVVRIRLHEQVEGLPPVVQGGRVTCPLDEAKTGAIAHRAPPEPVAEPAHGSIGPEGNREGYRRNSLPHASRVGTPGP